MSNWYLPLESDDYNFGDGDLDMFNRERLFPPDASVAMAENGSMDMNIISIFMKHLNRFVRKFVASDRHYLLLLVGHSSRKGINWLEIAKHHKCEVVQSPANTSHFLQPCDADVNKRFKDIVRRVRDKFCGSSNGRTDTRTIQTKLMFGTRAFEAISPADIRRSWEVTGLWSMDFRFAERYKCGKDSNILTAEKRFAAAEVGGPAASIMSVKQRHSDKETFDLLASIVDKARMEGCARVSTALQNASVCLNNRQTINNILMARERSAHSTTRTGVSENRSVNSKPKTFALSAGAPAQYLTHRDMLEKRREQEREEAEKTATKSLLCAERAAKKPQREEEKKKGVELREAAKKHKNVNSSKTQTKRRVDANKVSGKRGERQEMGAALTLAALGSGDGGIDGSAQG